jgi:hypothetical protein
MLYQLSYAHRWQTNEVYDSFSWRRSAAIRRTGLDRWRGPAGGFETRPYSGKLAERQTCGANERAAGKDLNSQWAVRFCGRRGNAWLRSYPGKLRTCCCSRCRRGEFWSWVLRPGWLERRASRIAVDVFPSFVNFSMTRRETSAKKSGSPSTALRMNKPPRSKTAFGRGKSKPRYRANDRGATSQPF